MNYAKKIKNMLLSNFIRRYNKTNIISILYNILYLAKALMCAQIYEINTD